MPRIILKEQSVYGSRYIVEIKDEHMNLAGHLDNSLIIAFVNQARAAMLKEMGFNEGFLGVPGVGVIIAEIAVNFRSEVFSGETLLVESGIGEISGKGFRFFHRISCGERLAALAEAGAVSFDYKIRKPVAVPEPLVRKVSEK